MFLRSDDRPLSTYSSFFNCGPVGARGPKGPVSDCDPRREEPAPVEVVESEVGRSLGGEDLSSFLTSFRTELSFTSFVTDHRRLSLGGVCGAPISLSGPECG